MVFPVKTKYDLGIFENLAGIESKVKQVLFSKKMGAQCLAYVTENLYEPFTKTFESIGEKLLEETTATTKPFRILKKNFPQTVTVRASTNTQKSVN